MVWQLGTVPYLNADPLAAALREPDAERLVGEPVSLEALIPSELLPQLLAGALDAALVSTGGVLPYEELRILPGGCVASHGPVRSIQLYCRRPVAEVESVALDASSRSAVALARVLFAERWKTSPQFVTRPPHLPSMLEEADAALLIGNPALQANQVVDGGGWSGPPLQHLDLGAEWDDLTGLPFVYAIWAAPLRRESGPIHHERLAALLLKAQEWGLAHRPELAERGAAELGLSRELCYQYLTESIRYDLGPAERAGMERFCELAVRHGVLPPTSAVRFC